MWWVAQAMWSGLRRLCGGLQVHNHATSWPNLQERTCKNSSQVEFQVGPKYDKSTLKCQRSFWEVFYLKMSKNCWRCVEKVYEKCRKCQESVKKSSRKKWRGTEGMGIVSRKHHGSFKEQSRKCQTIVKDALEHYQWNVEKDSRQAGAEVCQAQHSLSLDTN